MIKDQYYGVKLVTDISLCTHFEAKNELDLVSTTNAITLLCAQQKVNVVQVLFLIFFF